MSDTADITDVTADATWHILGPSPATTPGASAAARASSPTLGAEPSTSVANPKRLRLSRLPDHQTE